MDTLQLTVSIDQMHICVHDRYSKMAGQTQRIVPPGPGQHPPALSTPSRLCRLIGTLMAAVMIVISFVIAFIDMIIYKL